MQRHGARGAHRRAVSRGRTEWRTFLETRAAAHRELLILACPGHLPRELLGLEVAHDPRRHAQHERPGRHDEARGDEARGANKSLLLHHRVVHDDRADADEHAAAYGAPVKDRPVADVRVLLEPRLPAGKGVQHAAVLHVRARAEDDAPEVAPQRRAGADITARSYQAIADEHRLRVHERSRVDDRNETFQTVRRHARLRCGGCAYGAARPRARKALMAVRNSSERSCAPKMRASASIRARISSGSPRSRRRVSRSAPCGCRATSSASFRASERSDASSTRRLTSPRLKAVAASKGLPRRRSSAARCGPTSRGNSSELAASGTSPSLTNGIDSCAVREATMRSQCSSMVTPMPTACPCTPATSGFPNVARVCRNPITGCSLLNSGPFRKSLRSFPAQNPAPSPVSSTTRTVSSASAPVRPR